MKRSYVRVQDESGSVVEVMHGSGTPVKQRKQTGYTWYEVTGDPNLVRVQGLDEKWNWTVSDGKLVRR